ncbi:phage major capsid family protein|nr:phage major capsid protein [Rhizobium altiplani]
MREPKTDEILEAVQLAFTDVRSYVDGQFGQRERKTGLMFKNLNDRLDETKRLAIANRRQIDTGAKRRSSPRSILIKSLTTRLMALALKRGEPDKLAEQLYGAGKIVEATRDPVGWLRKAVTNPAMTSVPGWAAELANPGVYGGVMSELAPTSVYAALKARGISVNLTGTSGLRFAARAKPGSIPNCFIGEGQPIPVRQLSFLEGAFLTPHKAASISLFTGELAKASTPSAEAIIGQALAEDIGISVDTALLGNAAGTATQPPGLLFGVTPLTPSAASDPATAASADMAALAAAINPAAASPVFVMNSIQATNAAMLVPGFGAVDVIASDTVPAKTAIALDAADFVSSVDDGEVRVETDASIVSRDDPTPVSTGASGTDAASGSPHLSLWQMDLLAIRIVEDISWEMRRAGRVSVVANVKW